MMNAEQGATLGPASSAKTVYDGMAWPVLRYCRREGSHWVNQDNGDGACTLHLKAGQLMLIQSGTVLESLPLSNHSQTHGIVKGDTILIAARHETTARKFKIRLSSMQASQDCVKFLQCFFPITDITKPEQSVPIPLGQMYHQLMQTTPSECLPNPDSLPASFPLEETLYMCILDPSFPDLVSRVTSVLNHLDITKEASCDK